MVLAWAAMACMGAPGGAKAYPHHDAGYLGCATRHRQDVGSKVAGNVTVLRNVQAMCAAADDFMMINL